ncbi:MAG: hypothetical protein L6R40_003697 [Gallowayella cf. fulva]|nr:MAG: hypothetical protein L6R40_003697 [Xanthomendoza cf. fulva]
MKDMLELLGGWIKMKGELDGLISEDDETSLTSEIQLDSTGNADDDPGIREQQVQSVASTQGDVVKRKAANMEAGDGRTERTNIAIRRKKQKTKPDFEAQVRKAQRLSDKDDTPLVATQEQWRAGAQDIVLNTHTEGTLLDQFIAAEKETHTTRTHATSAQIIQLLQSVEFIKVYHRLIEDASQEDSATKRELEAMELWTSQGVGHSSRCMDMLLVKKYGFTVEKGRLKDGTKNQEIKDRRKALQNEIGDSTRVHTYTKYLGLGAVVYMVGMAREEQLFKKLPAGLLSIVAQTVAEVIPICREMADRVFEEIFGSGYRHTTAKAVGNWGERGWSKIIGLGDNYSMMHHALQRPPMRRLPRRNQKQDNESRPHSYWDCFR